MQIDWCTSPVIELVCAPCGSPVGALDSVVADTGSYIQPTLR
jgi:hypothetical protein